MIDTYLALKWLHILSSTVLFGTGIGTAFQMVWAMRQGKPKIVAAVSDGVVTADWLFTLPAGIVQPLTGVLLALSAGYALSEAWLVITYALYLLVLACWLPVVRLQYRIRDLARSACATETPLPLAARHAFRTWFALGWPAFGALLVIYWLMVAKPPLWS